MSRLFSSSPLILGAIEDIDINLVVEPKYRFRQKQLGIEELAASIREKGLLQPLVVRPKLDHFEIIAGIRRFWACKTNGWKKIICHIVELDDKESFEVALIENIQRKDLDPIEEANAFKNYILSFGWGGISDLASKVGKSISYIDKRIRLLELPEDIVEKISYRIISPSLGEELFFIENDNYAQRKIVEIASNSRLSTKKARRLIRNMDRISAYGYDDQEMSQDLGFS